MDDDYASQRAITRTRTRPHESGLAAHPDRIALWAVIMALVACVAAATSAKAGSGGISTGLDANGCMLAAFGERTMKRGDCGADVRTLNWILRSRPYQKGVGLNQTFKGSTEATVSTFQKLKGLPKSGIVDRKTRRTLVGSLPKTMASYFGPGLFGNSTACGQTLTRKTIGVAHRTLPCGTKLTVAYHGRAVRATVIDRGPYGRLASRSEYQLDWDLTQRTAQLLGFTGNDHVRVAVIRRRG